MKNIIMKMRYWFILASSLLLISSGCSEKYETPSYLQDYSELYQEDPRKANLQWFKDARFGMFIHYGLYSQLGKGEWVQLIDTIPLDEYAQLKDRFTASGFDADFIVELAKKAGMKHITITSMHHDGFCLFKTNETEFNSVNSPADRDLIGEMADACDRGGIGLFLYYSYAANWKHPWFYSREAGWPNASPAYKVQPQEYKYEKPEDFRKYVDYVHAQLTELITQYPSMMNKSILSCISTVFLGISSGCSVGAGSKDNMDQKEFQRTIKYI